MNHGRVMLAITAIVAAAGLATAVFAVPQQAMAYRHHNNNHNNNSIKVDQQISQLNACNGTSTKAAAAMNTGSGSSGSSTTCLNIGSNSADVGR